MGDGAAQHLGEEPVGRAECEYLGRYVVDGGAGHEAARVGARGFDGAAVAFLGGVVEGPREYVDVGVRAGAAGEVGVAGEHEHGVALAALAPVGAALVDGLHAGELVGQVLHPHLFLHPMEPGGASNPVEGARKTGHFCGLAPRHFARDLGHGVAAHDAGSACSAVCEHALPRAAQIVHAALYELEDVGADLAAPIVGAGLPAGVAHHALAAAFGEHPRRKDPRTRRDEPRQSAQVAAHDVAGRGAATGHELVPALAVAPWLSEHEAQRKEGLAQLQEAGAHADLRRLHPAVGGAHGVLATREVADILWREVADIVAAFAVGDHGLHGRAAGALVCVQQAEQRIAGRFEQGARLPR